MSREQRYKELVLLRKGKRFPPGLLNPSEIQGGRFDSDELGPWSRWQGNLHADLVIVGQDWGDEPYFLCNSGRDDDREATCKNLSEMALSAGWDLGSPTKPIPQPLFLTNAVLGIRAQRGKSGTPPAAWVADSLPFLVKILDIIQPKAVVSLGSSAARACKAALLGTRRDSPFSSTTPLAAIHALNPITTDGMPAWFAFYHCGPLGLANRSRDLQREDWRSLGEWLRQLPAIKDGIR